MATNNDNQKKIIIIKKRGDGGHAAAHGGAWKVAYADFITAMMALFMVMWLMGADEETKEIIQGYFNADGNMLSVDSMNKNGIIGGGDASARADGAQGRFSEEWVKRPTATAPVYLEEQATLSSLRTNFDGAAFSSDTTDDLNVMFNVPGEIKFSKRSNEIPENALRYLSFISNALKEHDGSVVIRGWGDTKDDWAMAFGRAMAVRNALVEEYGVNPNKLIPTAAYQLEQNNRVVAEALDKLGLVKFILKKTREERTRRPAQYE
ncbi:MAG: hypothetical protein A2504_15665 [Bdellovibrionales bacterium RIFOXYD12_FULL_39_22]|nr:MAG: hypothetical protein A2385_03095 [Bdellovibrionales bacterium RIFOXYB1_FULL_39_21]OFZ43231.1 MAG: hypothetical protein A2485_12240 [Bdellovibrionales bacterium RIFOXYC12_FULL_39_17]OFZ47969.1 MAG: hypothetical protein A2404_16880 [Bdellovibrionales bacterium RIFOXYC1_FULL_39_130]OFZ75749.1 MAG: hypothetical protein A2560_13380 [Bdellovibrionales bacterium RIFOXYD1_FULL_39_84]OFZ94239.1 MAG: hypothetical protein A2504_15665 [Bdellovibrionales bacterium RIFOXYD12_FULL_39_22]HLE11691.1 fl